MRRRAPPNGSAATGMRLLTQLLQIGARRPRRLPRDAARLGRQALRYGPAGQEGCRAYLSVRRRNMQPGTDDVGELELGACTPIYRRTDRHDLASYDEQC